MKPQDKHIDTLATALPKAAAQPRLALLTDKNMKAIIGGACSRNCAAGGRASKR